MVYHWLIQQQSNMLRDAYGIHFFAAYYKTFKLQQSNMCLSVSLFDCLSLFSAAEGLHPYQQWRGCGGRVRPCCGDRGGQCQVASALRAAVLSVAAQIPQWLTLQPPRPSYSMGYLQSIYRPIQRTSGGKGINLGQKID